MGNFKKTLVVLIVLAVQCGFGRPRIPSLVQVPTADLLPHGLFNAYTQMNFFTTHDMQGDSSQVFNYPFYFGFDLGFQNRAQFGFQYGDQVSISFKAYILEAPEELYIPDITVGARSIFGSQEGRFYGIKSDDTLDILRNEAYLALSSNISENTRVHTGASVIPGIDDGEAMIFAGVEQYLGMGMYMTYEVFNRFLQFNHQAGFILKIKNYFSFSVGLSQIQEWLVQDGKWGFYPLPEGYTSHGYNSPGIKVALSIGGYTLRSNEKTDREEMISMRSEQQEFRLDLSKMKEQVENTKLKIAQLERRDEKVKELENRQVTDYLDLIAQKLNSDIPFDPIEITSLRNQILSLPVSSLAVLKKIVTNPTTNIEHRVQACILMALSGRDEFVKPLLQATNDPEPRVRRESILALANMKLKIALEYAEILLDDTDESVVSAAKEAIRIIKAATGQGTVINVRPDVP